MSIEDAEKRMKSQMPIGLKLKMADIKINNDGDLDELKAKVIKELAPFVS